MGGPTGYGDERSAARQADEVERGLQLLSRAWIGLVAVCWLSVGWTTDGHDHVVEPLVVVVSPFVIAGLLRIRAGLDGRAHDVMSLTVAVAIALAVLDPVLGYWRGTVAGGALPFVGIPLFCLAMHEWTQDQGFLAQARRPWARATAWATPFALLVVAAWAALVARGLATGRWGDIDLRGSVATFAILIGLGVLLPGSLIATWTATRGTSAHLRRRPYRFLG
jgi:hypothetical protein